MYWPEKLYQLTAKDAGKAAPRILWKRADSGSVAAASFSQAFQNDTGLLWVIQSLEVGTLPGAAQTYQGAEWYVQDAGGNTIVTLTSDSVAGGVAAETHRPAFGCWYVPPLYKLLSLTRFNAGANANRAVANVQGLMIPTGTLLTQ